MLFLLKQYHYERLVTIHLMAELHCWWLQCTAYNL